MALHTALLNEQSRELVPARMQYPVEASGLLGTSKIMQYKSPDFGQTFSGETGNNVIRFTLNGPGLLDPRSLYLRWSWQNVSGAPMVHCDPGSYSPIKRVRILSGFNQQILYDLDGYNSFCAFLDDYQKSIHDFATDTHGFYALRTSSIRDRISDPDPAPLFVNDRAAVNGVSYQAHAGVPGTTNVLGSEFLQWEFRPVKQFVASAIDECQWVTGAAGDSVNKIFSVCDLPHIGFFTQGKYIPLWGLGGIILELYIDQANSWCTYAGNPTQSTQVNISDVELFYDNIVPPAKFLETMREVIDSAEGLSFVFPSVNRHLNSIAEVPAGQTRKTELLVPDHSRMAQAIFQIYRPLGLTTANDRVYKLHNRCPAKLLSWQAKLNSSYLPQQPLRANRAGGAAAGNPLSRQYLQFHKELMKALGQQRRSMGSVTPTVYEHDSAVDNVSRGAFAVGIDLTVSDDVITGTNLRNATVTGEMFINIEQRNDDAGAYPAIEVQTYIMKLSQIRLTSAGPVLVD